MKEETMVELFPVHVGELHFTTVFVDDKGLMPASQIPEGRVGYLFFDRPVGQPFPKTVDEALLMVNLQR